MGSKNFNFKVAGIRNLINFLNFLVILENHEIGLYVDILFSQNPILWIPIFPWFDNFFKPIWIKYAWSPDFSDLVMGLCCCCWVIRSYPTLCDPMDCSPPGSSVHADSPGKYTAVGCHALLQGIFPTQGLNQGLLIAGGFFKNWTTREAHCIIKFKSY